MSNAIGSQLKCFKSISVLVEALFNHCFAILNLVEYLKEMILEVKLKNVDGRRRDD